ncbi:hypothetical protein IWX65_002098 [Arthrobacter sp. CAN_A214]|uniref:hypothetical protein n=1 Tax=Arthrobacter sp. CAN_A214 TaxID=2787720 RepID=UPI0018CA9B01
MRTSAFFIAPTLAFSALALAAGPASADDGAASYSAVLAPVNNSGTSGQVMIHLAGDQATISMSVAGAPSTLMGMPYMHAQHIHIGGQGVCAGPAADADGDGVVSSLEGLPFEGPVGTSLTVEGDTSPASGAAAHLFPAGGAYDYSRTITLDAATIGAIQAGNAVAQVHGADPSLLSAAAQQKVNPMNPALPFATDVPIACGSVVASQMSGPLPRGGADTGVEGAQAVPETHSPLAAAGLLLLAAGATAGTALGWRRQF